MLVVWLLVAAICIPVHTSRAGAAAPPAPSLPTIMAAPGFDQACALYQTDTGLGCRDATREEAAAIARPRDARTLHVISPPEINQTNGLTIILRATDQLEQNPVAKAAFLKAAALWQSVILTPITVVIDVDFGPMWFGEDFPAGVVGLTNPQNLFAEPVYPALHGRLLDLANTQKKNTLYLNLPGIIVPTDKGETQAIVAPSAMFRVWGFIDAVADPDHESGSWGHAPAIGFDSRVAYDFDPSNGIDADKEDFDAVACHEIGHVLGFTSYVGQLEMNPDAPLALSIWDLFRVGPGANLGGFASATRILSSGGAQYFYAGGDSYGLSTGKPDGTGGDGRQASHWRDDAIAGEMRLGVLDPTLPAGRRETITLKDLEALDAFGYWLKPIGNAPPALTQLAGDLNGDVLTLSGTLTDADGDVVQAQLEMLDEKGRVLGQTAPFAVDFGVPTSQFFNFTIRQMGSQPAVMQVRLSLIDTRGNQSKTMLTDFSGGDTGGPRLISAGYKAGTLNVKGKKFGEQPQIEVNGTVITPPLGFDNVTPKRVAVSGQADSLNLKPGANRIRIISNGLRSNLLVIDM
ncbi:MAG TPA: NF038122 family metalloprotease [Blastocatellia bacterium]|nr:NF038122 family metalloprotease [Blastocatellia bacterium]